MTFIFLKQTHIMKLQVLIRTQKDGMVEYGKSIGVKY